jgi:5-methylthioadenosine/S-adenosylhomocysteine deaminase
MTEATRTILGNAAVIPLDGQRQILDPGHVVVEAGRIATVAAGAWPEGETPAARRIDLDGAALIPGLIDLHLHAGHGLTKNLGGDVDAWMDTVGDVYARHADAEFWAADAALQALERTLGGTTLAVPFFGGGDNVMRTEDTACAEAHLREIEASGLREILVLGVDRPPFPKPRRAWTEGRAVERSMSLSDQIAAIGTLAGRWRGAGLGLIDIAVSAPRDRRSRVRGGRWPRSRPPCARPRPPPGPSRRAAAAASSRTGIATDRWLSWPRRSGCSTGARSWPIAST